MTHSYALPIPIFDTLEALERNNTPLPEYVDTNDFDITRSFLLAYQEVPIPSTPIAVK